MAVVEGSPAVALARPARSSRAAEDLLILLLIVVMPFVASPPMQVRIMDIPGFKIPNIIAALAFLVFVGSRNTWVVEDRLQRKALIAFSAYFAVFTVAFLRSVPNIPRFHALFPVSFQPGFLEYSQTYFVVPVLFALSFVYILQHMCSRSGLLNTVAAISVAVFLLSCVVIVATVSHPAALLDPNRSAVHELAQDYLGLHYNAAGTVYVIAGPLLLYMALTRGRLWSINFVLALVAVLLLKSRTAIFTFGAMNALTLIVLGRTKTLMVLAPIVVVAALALLGAVLLPLLTQGITVSGFSTYMLLSGREQAIWLPLLAEWVGDPHRFWLGAGLFGIMTSDFIYSARSIFAAGQAHNFYLEFFLDNGVVAFLLFVGALAAWLIRSCRLGARIQSQNLLGPFSVRGVVSDRRVYRQTLLSRGGEFSAVPHLRGADQCDATETSRNQYRGPAHPRDPRAVRLLFVDFSLPYLLRDSEFPVGGWAVQLKAWLDGLSGLGHHCGVLTWKGANDYAGPQPAFDLIETYDPGIGIRDPEICILPHSLDARRGTRLAAGCDRSVHAIRGNRHHGPYCRATRRPVHLCCRQRRRCR